MTTGMEYDFRGSVNLIFHTRYGRLQGCFVNSRAPLLPRRATTGFTWVARKADMRQADAQNGNERVIRSDMSAWGAVDRVKRKEGQQKKPQLSGSRTSLRGCMSAENQLLIQLEGIILPKKPKPTPCQGDGR